MHCNKYCYTGGYWSDVQPGHLRDGKPFAARFPEMQSASRCRQLGASSVIWHLYLESFVCLLFSACLGSCRISSLQSPRSTYWAPVPAGVLRDGTPFHVDSPHTAARTPARAVRSELEFAHGVFMLSWHRQRQQPSRQPQQPHYVAARRL